MQFKGALLYRGTTPNWSGSKGLQRTGLTPTSTDPLVATLFALECLRYGPAIVQFCEVNSVVNLIAPGNVLADLEREVVVAVAPDIFTVQFVVSTLTVQLSREILAELGYEL